MDVIDVDRAEEYKGPSDKHRTELQDRAAEEPGVFAGFSQTVNLPLLSGGWGILGPRFLSRGRSAFFQTTPAVVSRF